MDEYRVFILEPSGKITMHDNLTCAEICKEVSSISLSDLRDIAIENPADVDPHEIMSVRGLVIFTLMQSNDVLPKIGSAKSLLAEQLVLRGFNKKELSACVGGAKLFGRSIVDKVACYLNSLQGDLDKVEQFVALSFERGWTDDEAAFHWFKAMTGDKVSFEE